MTENSLKNKIGILLIILHFFVLSLVLFAFLRGGFRFDEFTTTVAIIVPMFAGYTTAIIVYFSSNRFKSEDTSREVTAIFAVLSAAFPLTMFIALAVSIIFFASSKAFSNFEEFKGTLSILETIFAAYVAKFAYTLFDKVEDKQDATQAKDT